MARKLRLQYPGAVYHVINRGNYRQDVFETADKAMAFERCVFETCERMRWRLHAYALMRNHYHLALETPQGDLVAGMHWLQTTFATRFNRFRREHGHLFQGRYHAQVVEPGAALARVVDYIHLNPVRAGIVPVEHLVDFRWSSLRRFVRGPRPPFLQADDWLTAGGFTPDATGWRAYCEHLQVLAADPERQKELGFDGLSQGWAIGTEGWRRAMAQEQAHHALDRGVPQRELDEINQAHWTAELDRHLTRARKSRMDAAKDWKGAAWKIVIAAEMRRQTSVSNRWLAENLHMGAASSVSQYVSEYRRKDKNYNTGGLTP